MLKELNAENVVGAIKNVALPAIGFSGSGALMTQIPDKNKKIIKGGLIATSMLLGALTQGSDKEIKPVTQILIGATVNQAFSLAKDVFKDKLALTADSDITDELMAGALGLACPDGSCQRANEQYYDAVYGDTYNGSFTPALNYPESYDTVYQEEVVMDEDSSFI
ncbi:hypothetical protein [Aquimarina aggregata]|uniref:hypothetical protein n=1 Tax=Aquimarina aggregata TaxID=1642818 RepID=UPI002490E257|nr:hypothetical protein [Aquimarina aggregata]